MHIDKEKIRITVLIGEFRIEGDMYRYPGARLLDLVNVKEQAFLPLTDVEIFKLGSEGKSIKISFMGVNRNQVQFFYPNETDASEEHGPEEHI